MRTYTVFLLQNASNPNKTYTGYTGISVTVCAGRHSQGKRSPYTARLGQWRLVMAFHNFFSKQAAIQFATTWKRRSRGGLLAHLQAGWRMGSRNRQYVLASFFSIEGRIISTRIRTDSLAARDAWLKLEARNMELMRDKWALLQEGVQDGVVFL